MDEAGKITGIYERKLIRRMIQSDAETREIYRLFIGRVSPVLEKFRQLNNGIVIRDPEIQKELEKYVSEFSENMKASILKSQGDAWKLSNEKTDEIIHSYIADNPVNTIAEAGLFSRTNEAFNAFQQRKRSGLKLSDRVWKLSQENLSLIETYVENGLSVGRSAVNIAKDVGQLLNNPDKIFRRVRDKETGKLKLSARAKEYNPGQGVYRSSYQNARRLARTETNMAYRTADQERWKTMDFILGYEVKLSAQHPAPDICDSAAGMYPKDFRFVGWHPACFCFTVPVMMSTEDFIKKMNGEDVATSTVTDIPEKFKQYIEDNKERISGWKRQPFWVEDNFKGGRIEKGLKS